MREVRITEHTLQSAAIINTVPILIIIFLLFFLRANWRYEVRMTSQFMPPTLLLMILLVLDNLDFYGFINNRFGDMNQILHRFVGMLQYDVRILLMAFLISAVSVRLSPRKHTKFWTILPAAVNVPVLLPCMFTDLYFWYDESSHIVRGPLHYEPHILSALYIVFLFVLAVLASKRGRNTETGILVITGTSVVTAVVVEMIFEVRGILLSVIALSILGYYLYVHIEHFRFDNLTGVLNREALKVDVERYGNRTISHVLSIDMNGLKVINDTKGHEEGDKAIKAVAHALESSLLPKCRIYRIGGDEFSVLCILKSTDDVNMMIEKMYSTVEATGYTCAVGYSEWYSGKSFNEVYNSADNAMYENKRRIKACLAEDTKSGENVTGGTV